MIYEVEFLTKNMVFFFWQLSKILQSSSTFAADRGRSSSRYSFWCNKFNLLPGGSFTRQVWPWSDLGGGWWLCRFSLVNFAQVLHYQFLQSCRARGEIWNMFYWFRSGLWCRLGGIMINWTLWKRSQSLCIRGKLKWNNHRYCRKKREQNLASFHISRHIICRSKDFTQFFHFHPIWFFRYAFV